MATEEITIFRADTGEAVKSIADLKESIKNLKKDLEGLTIGSDEYVDTLKQLQVQQAALKNAMYATTKAGEDETDTFAKTARAAKGLGTSYNALVKQMADLTQQFRATEDEAKRDDLAKQIRNINEELKKLDANRGIYGRNVGDYFNQITTPILGVLDAMPDKIGGVINAIKNTGQALGLLEKHPVLAVVQLLAPIISNIVSGLEDSTTALAAVKKVGDALKPVAKFFEGILETIAGWLSDAVDWLLTFAKESGISFDKIVGKVVGFGNAIKEFLLIPIRNTITGAKALGNIFQDIFTGQFKKAATDAKAAIKEIGDNFKTGFSFKANFESGEAAGEAFVKGLQSNKLKKKAKNAGKSLLDEIQKELLNDLDLNLKDYVEIWEKHQDDALKSAKKAEELRLKYLADGMAKRAQMAELEINNERELEAKKYEITKEANEKRLELLNQFYTDAVARGDLETALAYDQEREDLEYEIAYNGYLRKKALREQEIEDYFTYASVVSNVFGSIADIFEASGEEDEKAAKQAKVLRTASAVIDTISGAIGAYMQTVKTMPAPFNIPVAAANAAAVLAAGYAQIKKINSVQVGSGGSSSAGGSSALVSAPAFAPAISMTRNVTGRNEEERLNRMAADNRVYLVYSDIEIANTRQRVKVRETEF